MLVKSRIWRRKDSVIPVISTLMILGRCGAGSESRDCTMFSQSDASLRRSKECKFTPSSWQLISPERPSCPFWHAGQKPPSISHPLFFISLHWHQLVSIPILPYIDEAPPSESLHGACHKSRVPKNIREAQGQAC